MKTYEHLQLLLFPLFAIPWYSHVQQELKRIASSTSEHLEILDVGGRSSPYTIGIKANVTVSELPRETDIQKSLNLGMTDDINTHLLERRSNIKAVLIDDMTQSKIPDARYDVAVAVEVLEHVEEDVRFVENVYRILKPGGYFIMTTPNGKIVPNTNPDHKRHYTHVHLTNLLSQTFNRVEVTFSTRRNIIQYISLRSPKRWWYAAPLIYTCRAISNLESRYELLKNKEEKTEKLFAIAQKL